MSSPALRRTAKRCAGESAETAAVAPLAGGCVNDTLLLSLADGNGP